MLTGIHHGVMLDGRSDDMIARLGESEDRKVVAFGATAGEDNFRRPATQQFGDRLACPLHGRPRLLSMMVDGRSVAEVLGKVGTHCLQDLGKHGRSRVIV